jgi:polar amino acid transport system substrate-binding protein
MGSDMSYAPQEFFDPPGSQTAAGFDIDVAKAMADKMGLKFTAVNQGFDGLIPALDTKKFDIIMSALTVKPDRQAKIDMVPYFVGGQSFVVKKAGSFKPAKLEDLCGHKVAVQNGTTELDTVNDDLNAAGKPCASNKVDIQSFPTDTEALAQLKKDAVEVHYTDSPVASYEASKDSSVVVSTSAPFAVAPEGIGLRKSSPILDPIKKAFQAIRDDGTYKKLLDKWSLADGDISKA